MSNSALLIKPFCVTYSDLGNKPKLNPILLSPLTSVLSTPDIEPDIIRQSATKLKFWSQNLIDSRMKNMTSNISVCQVPFSMTKVDFASQLFLHHVQQIPGVVATRFFSPNKTDEQGIIVFVDNLFSPVTREVIHVQERVYDEFPNVRFSLEIKDASVLDHSL